MLHESVLRVILSYKRRLLRRLKKRSPGQRLKAKTYYRKHKRNILLRRKRYLTRNKSFLKTRKLYKRHKPSWMVGKQTKHKAPKLNVIRPKKHPVAKPRVFKPKLIKPKSIKVHVPKRT